MLTSQTLISLLAAGLALGSAPPDPNAGPPSAAGKWSIVTNGTAGVIALEAIIVSPTLALFFDRPANNTFSIDGHAAWGALYNLETNEPTALRLTTNTFCASGAFLSNGTMVSVGGSAAENLEDDDASGLQSVRLFGPCDAPDGAGCTVFEDVNNLHLAAARWYTTSIKIPDGSLMIIGGIAVPTPFYNDQPVNSFEFFPPKDGGVPRPSAFLEKTLPANLFPRAFLLPDGRVFMVANNRSQIYDIETNTEIPLPDIPNGVRVTNPFDGSGTILPLSPPDYIPEVLICGGTNISDATPALNVSSQTPASDQCSRIKLTPEGIKAGWQVERMLEGRMMPETLLLPNGQILITSGAMTGAAAVASVGNPVGNSNADHPALTPSLYTPTARLGQRISNAVMPRMNIPRMYHSSATLTPKGSVMLAGSNPNGLIQPPGTEKFPSEFRVDHLLPPFFNSARPSILSTPQQIRFSEQVTIPVNIPRGMSLSNIQVGLMDLGFSSHAWHSSQRLVFLVSSLSKDGKSLTIRAPPNGKIFPPGPAFIFLTVDNVWSTGSRLMIGSGRAPPTLD